MASLRVPSVAGPYAGRGRTLGACGPDIRGEVVPVFPGSVSPIPFALTAEPLGDSIITLPGVLNPAVLGAIPTATGVGVDVGQGLCHPVWQGDLTVRPLGSFTFSPSVVHPYPPVKPLLLYSLVPIPPLVARVLRSTSVPRGLPSIPCRFRYLPCIHHPMR